MNELPPGLIVAVKTRNKQGNTSFQAVEKVEEGPHFLRITMFDGTEQMFRWDYIDWCAIVPAEIYAERMMQARAEQQQGRLVTPSGEEVDRIVDTKDLD